MISDVESLSLMTHLDLEIINAVVRGCIQIDRVLATTHPVMDQDYVAKALVLAAERGDVLVMKYYLSGKQLENRDEVFRAAIGAGHMSVLKFLYSTGHHMGAKLESAVEFAAKLGHQEMVSFLVEMGADVSKSNAMFEACQNTDLEMMLLLQGHGAVLNEYCMAELVAKASVVFLIDLESKFDVDFATGEYLMIAAKHDQLGVLKWLQSKMSAADFAAAAADILAQAVGAANGVRVVKYMLRFNLKITPLMLQSASALGLKILAKHILNRCATNFVDDWLQIQGLVANQAAAIQVDLIIQEMRHFVDTQHIKYVAEAMAAQLGNEWLHVLVILHRIIDRSDMVHALQLLALDATAVGDIQKLQAVLLACNIRDRIVYASQVLSQAARYGQALIVKWICESKLDVYQAKDTALIEAAEAGNVEVMRILHRTGADVRADNYAALRQSVECARFDAVKFLVSAGVDVRYLNRFPIRPTGALTDVALMKYLHNLGVDFRGRNEWALRCAIVKNNLAAVQCLATLGVDIRFRQDWCFRHAAALGYIDLVRYLYELGAMASTKNNQALEKACAGNHTQVVDFLVEKLIISNNVIEM